MSTPPDPDLRTTLHRLADATVPLPVDDNLWQRGQSARRRGRAFAIAAVLALVVSVGGIATLVTTTDQEARTASSEVPEGAIPSRIDISDGQFSDELPTGRASVAYFLNGGITLIGAEDGCYHQLAPSTAAQGLSADPVVALSPDGRHLAWTATSSIAIADLVTGDTIELVPNRGRGADVDALSWYADSVQLRWNGRGPEKSEVGIIDVSGPSEQMGGTATYATRGIPSPSLDTVALPSTGEATAAPFLRAPVPGGGPDGERVSRTLPPDLYPAGAVVRPLGWAAEDLVVATVDPPQSDVVERPQLVLFTSPDRPESEWTYRILMRDLPPVESLTLAVDLIPDLDGTSSQQLTHDFGDPLASDGRDISWIIGLGVAAAIAVLLGLQWLWRRFT